LVQNNLHLPPFVWTAMLPWNG